MLFSTGRAFLQNVNKQAFKIIMFRQRYSRDYPIFGELGEEFGFNYDTECDADVILHLVARGGIEFAARHLDGMFAFCLVDTTNLKVYLDRDTFGVRPAFRIATEQGFLGVCSEATGLSSKPGRYDVHVVVSHGEEKHGDELRCHGDEDG